MLFGIVQGGTHADLRRENAMRSLISIFPDTRSAALPSANRIRVTCEMTHAAASRLPADRPRYLMGVGKPEQIRRLRRARRGHDGLRAAHAQRAPRLPLHAQGRLLIRNAQYADDPRPIDENCCCMVCRRTRARTCAICIPRGEILSVILNTHHNVYFFLDIMRQIREAIAFGKLESFRSDLQARLR